MAVGGSEPEVAVDDGNENEEEDKPVRILLLGDPGPSNPFSTSSTVGAGLLRYLGERDPNTVTQKQLLRRPTVGGSPPIDSGKRFEVIDLLAAEDDSDVLGHILVGSSHIDVVLLLVGVDRKACDACVETKSRTYENVLLSETLGLRQLIIGLCGTGSCTPPFTEQRYREVQCMLEDMLGKAGYSSANVPFIPIAVDLANKDKDSKAFLSRKAIDTAEQLPSWYQGSTLRDAMLERGHVFRDMSLWPLRMPLSEIYKIGAADMVAVGRVEMGTITENMHLSVSPGGRRIKMRHLDVDGRAVASAGPGEVVRLVGLEALEPLGENEGGQLLEGDEPRVRWASLGPEEDEPKVRWASQGSELMPQEQQVKTKLEHFMGPGSIISDWQGAAQHCCRFLAQLAVLRDPHVGAIRAGYEPLLDVHTAHVRCRLLQLRWRRARGSRQVDVSPLVLGDGDIAEVWIQPLEPVCLETYCWCPPLGKIALRNGDVTVAAGVVKDWERARCPVAAFDY
eukprot:gnl/TRDRNA2_/TRDRNA2_169460_c0_seq1.p1 gnl/TRDRNA2_/TRDRNA2_169460_c0~~gnl/TRDRNA2_/TRDRNA2_169460_c0_seq1.p1  ORF type:complete len:508 (-),score=77.42 gnl/TRDRNA2_/TRDRNA2_169460_c0_seq1:104-1627(-)